MQFDENECYEVSLRLFAIAGSFVLVETKFFHLPTAAAKREIQIKLEFIIYNNLFFYNK